jgi:hypothetical protein
MARVKLHGACFQNAILRSADLTGAQLVQADFTGADLTGASFENANVQYAVFRDVQGLTDAQKDQLESQAQRWKLELKLGVAGIWGALYYPTYGLVICALVALSFPVLRSLHRYRIVVAAAVLNVLALLPAFVLLWMDLFGASRTAQLNVGRSGAMDLWMVWAQLWPGFFLGLLACLAVAIGLALVFLRSHWRWTALRKAKLPVIYLALTVVHCLFATHLIGSNFPTA